MTTFARLAIINQENRIRLEKYITGIVNNNSSKLYAIYANPQHVHILVSRSPVICEQELITDIADSSEKFINHNILSNGHFKWQQSASAFSVSKSDMDNVCQYILNQPEYHKKVTFKEEYAKSISYYEKTLKK